MFPIRGQRWKLALTATIFFAFAAAQGQSRTQDNRRVTGTVLDASGAVIAGADASLKDDQGHICGTVKTGTSGRFSLPACGAKLVLRVSTAGFQDFQKEVRPQATGTELQITLRVAAAIVGINVQSDAIEVSTDTAANLNTTEIDADAMGQLPVLDQDYITMMSDFLDPGALGTGGVTLVVNGVEANGPGVSASAVQSVKINNNPYSALFSRPGRARLEIVTKGGTPKVHGEVNASYRNSLFDATPAYAQSKPDEQRRYFEGSLTGPLGKSPQNTFLASADYDDLGAQAVVNAVTLAGPVKQTVPAPQKHFFGSFRAFHEYGKGNQFWIGYSYEWSHQENRGVGGTTLPQAGYQSLTMEHEINFSNTNLINEHWVNQLRGLVGHNAEPKLLSNVEAPQIIVSGAFISGGAQTDSKRTETHFDGNDTVTYSSGKHEVKFGIDVPDISRRGADDWTNQNGSYVFSSLAAYAAGIPQTLTLQRGDGHLVFLESTFALFAEDTFRVRPNLTLTYGARYYFQKYFHNDPNNIAPRLGFAWSPGNQRKLVLRGGSGLFYDRTGPRPIADLLHFNGINLRRYVIDGPAYPALPATAGLPVSEVVLDPNAEIPYTVQYSAGFELQLNKKSMLSSEWVGARGIKLFRSLDSNAPPPPLYSARPDASLGQVRTIQSAGHSLSNMMEVTFRSSSKHGMVQAQYRLSKATSDTDGITFFPSNSHFPGLDYSRASFDQRHRFSLLATVKLPSHFTAGTSFTVHSGRPYSETTGADNNLDGIINDRPAGVPRNSFQGDSHVHFDLRAGRDFHLRSPSPDPAANKDSGGGEGVVLNTSISAFNVINHRNNLNYVGVITSPFFGMPTGSDAPRRLQFNALLRF